MPQPKIDICRDTLLTADLTDWTFQGSESAGDGFRHVVYFHGADLLYLYVSPAGFIHHAQFCTGEDAGEDYYEDECELAGDGQYGEVAR